jgi:hypothetical protein
VQHRTRARYGHIKEIGILPQKQLRPFWQIRSRAQAEQNNAAAAREQFGALLPPMVIGEELLNEGLDILGRALAEL